MVQMLGWLRAALRPRRKRSSCHWTKFCPALKINRTVIGAIRLCWDTCRVLANDKIRMAANPQPQVKKQAIKQSTWKALASW